MSHRLLIHTAALGLTIAAIAAPVAVAQQDLRSPDAVDAAQTALASHVQDARSPDVRDAAEGRGTFSAPRVTVVKVAEASPASSSGGLDWGDAGIGAGALLAIVLITIGGSLVVSHRRRGPAAIG